MRGLISFSLLLTAFAVSGCVTRVTPYEVDRVDQELKGNRGVIMGKATDLSEPQTKKTRAMYNVEVELSSRELDRKKMTVEGNRGYITGKKVTQTKDVSALKPVKLLSGPRVVYQTPADAESKYKKEKGAGEVSGAQGAETTYVVQKGDTLQKISSKMYGTTKKWKKIFEANKDMLKDPDKIRAGQKLIIPAE